MNFEPSCSEWMVAIDFTEVSCLFWNVALFLVEIGTSAVYEEIRFVSEITCFGSYSLFCWSRTYENKSWFSLIYLFYYFYKVIKDLPIKPYELKLPLELSS